MSEEQFKIWKQVEAKGLEKLEKVEKVLASTEKEGFKEAHKDYCDFIEKLAETTGLTSGELDRHFTTLLSKHTNYTTTIQRTQKPTTWKRKKRNTTESRRERSEKKKELSLWLRR